MRSIAGRASSTRDLEPGGASAHTYEPRPPSQQLMVTAQKPPRSLGWNLLSFLARFPSSHVHCTPDAGQVRPSRRQQLNANPKFRAETLTQTEGDSCRCRCRTPAPVSRKRHVRASVKIKSASTSTAMYVRWPVRWTACGVDATRPTCDRPSPPCDHHARAGPTCRQPYLIGPVPKAHASHTSSLLLSRTP